SLPQCVASLPFFSPPSGHKPYIRKDHFSGGRPDLFAVLEDDIKQFRDALFGVLRAVPQQITLAIRRGLSAAGTKDRQTSGQAIADKSRD
ncbi:MAG: hypothetical protein WA478_01210, partial [Pseudolabrys sp.]